MKEFRIKISFLLLALFFTANIIAQTITFQSNTIFEGKMKFAEQYGDNVFLKRELNASDNGKYIFYFDSLLSGLYYIVLPDSSSFEFMYDSDYSGKITIAQLKDNKYKVLSAPEPTIKYNEYIQKIEKTAVALDSIRLALKQYKLKSKEKKNLLVERDNLHKETDDFINSVSFEYSGSLLGAYLKAKQKVNVPEYTPSPEIANKDSAIWDWRMKYYNKHFLDNLNLSDERLIRTPVYTEMINTYLDKITMQQPEEIISSISAMLNRAEKSNTAYIFLSDYLLNKYNSLKNASIYELVYLHIIEAYYLNANSAWVINTDKSMLLKEYNSRKPLAMGHKSPNIIMKNLLGSDTSLYLINSDYTILYFYNYDCELCRITSPELIKISQRFNHENVKVFSVCLGDDNKKCKKYILKNDLLGWTNVFDSEKANTIALRYNLRYTPTLFLLDKDKNIVSKNLNTGQLKEILEQNIKY